jgi:hypothetical protein
VRRLTGNRPNGQDAGMARQRKARISDVDEIALSLPGVEQSEGERPNYSVNGKEFVVRRGPRKDAIDPATGEMLEDVIYFHCRLTDKEAMAADEGSPWFTTPHFNGYPAVLVRESRIRELTRAELAEVITDAWLIRAPKRLSKRWLAEQAQ